jgi:hypothetical protein
MKNGIWFVLNKSFEKERETHTPNQQQNGLSRSISMQRIIKGALGGFKSG